MGQLITFIVWQSGINHLNRILYEISQNYEIKRVYNLEWQKDEIISKLNKLYPNRKFSYESSKLKECGFLGGGLSVFVIVAYDNEPNIVDGVNLNVVNFKKKERNIYPESANFLHASDNESEAYYNLKGIIEIDYNEFFSLKYEETKFCYCDILSKPFKIECYEDINFESVVEIFSILNDNVIWTVLRNWENLPEDSLLEGHGDLDILVDDFYKTVAILRGRKPKHIKHLKHRVHHYVKIQSSYLPVDIRYLGDNYYDLNWEIELLNNRVFSNGFYRLDDENYYWSLFYHAFIHKFSVSEDYKIKLQELSKKLDLNHKINFFIPNTYYNIKYLNQFMNKKKYKYMEPIDLSVKIRYPKFRNRLLLAMKTLMRKYKMFSKAENLKNNVSSRIRNRINYNIRNLKRNGFISHKILVIDQVFEIYTRQMINSAIDVPRLVVVSYLPRKNTIPILKMCIDSIIKFTDTPYELWVVDNNSPMKNISWLLDYKNINLILSRNDPKEKGSFANGIGLEIATKIIHPGTKYLMTLHQDIAICKKGWLEYMLSKFDNETKAVGVRMQDGFSKEGILHVLGYIIDFQLFKKMNLSFMPVLPKYDVGDKAISDIKKAGYKIFATPNTFTDKTLVEKISDNSFLKKFNVDRSFNDKGDVIFLHLGRGLAKSTGKKVRTSSVRSVKVWIDTLTNNLFPEKKLIKEAKNRAHRNITYSIRRYYVDKFFFENIHLFSDNCKILDIGGKKTNKRGLFNIDDSNLNVKYANLDETTEPDYLCDATNIPVDDESFDGAILAEVLEHVKDPMGVLQEAYRILKNNGILLITVPFLYPIHADPFDYGRYTDTWFNKVLKDIGFKEIEIEFQGSYYAVMANNFKWMANEYNKIVSWKKLNIKYILLKYVNFVLSKYYFRKERKHKSINDYRNKYTTGFGIVCRK